MKRWKIVLFCFLSVIAVCAIARKRCQTKEVKYGYVCVNDDDHCDSLYTPEPSGNEYVLVTSAKKKDRFVYKIGKFDHGKDGKKCKTVIKVDSSITYQTIKGFGGAYSGAVTHLVNRLSPNLRKCLFKSYFSQSFGAGYNYLRVPIGGTDFDLRPWAYNEHPENDAKLSNFKSLDPRDLKRNAHIKECMRVAKNPHVKLLAVAWGPPPWMKYKNHWHGGLDNQLKPEFYQTWADYHLRWLELMDEDGMDIWAMATGNEPASAKQIKFQILSWNPDDQARWIAQHLGPTLEKSKFNCELHGFDDNRDLAPKWIAGMEKGDPKAMDYLDGLEFHAYSDKALDAEYLDKCHAKYGVDIWYSENCFGAFFMTKYIGPQLGTWGRAEKLCSIMMENFAHSTVGYIDWNLILDHTGGPTYANNSIDAYMILSKDGKKIYKQPTFYVMAHFSKFIWPGSIRIDAHISKCKGAELDTLAFLRPDNKVVLIIYNYGEEKSTYVTVNDKSKGKVDIKLKPQSINTLVYELKSASKKCKSGRKC